jgi:hypothetical protein
MPYSMFCMLFCFVGPPIDANIERKAYCNKPLWHPPLMEHKQHCVFPSWIFAPWTLFVLSIEGKRAVCPTFALAMAIKHSTTMGSVQNATSCTSPSVLFCFVVLWIINDIAAQIRALCSLPLYNYNVIASRYYLLVDMTTFFCLDYTAAERDPQQRPWQHRVKIQAMMNMTARTIKMCSRPAVAMCMTPVRVRIHTIKRIMPTTIRPSYF